MTLDIECESEEQSKYCIRFSGKERKDNVEGSVIEYVQPFGRICWIDRKDEMLYAVYKENSHYSKAS